MPEPERVVDRIGTHCFWVPTDRPESDGTFAWNGTTVVVVELHSGRDCGLGYTYGPRAVASVIGHELGDVVLGSDALAPRHTWEAMHGALRNAGQSGIGAMAISALDIALHDLRARVLGLPLALALDAIHDSVPVYGSGGFTSYGPHEVAEQLGGWVQQDIPRVKMKVGRHPEQDDDRLRAAREAIGDTTELMVDANGAFSVQAAIAQAHRYARFDVRYLEEPVTQDDPAGLARVRDLAPPLIAIASGEYSWSRYDTVRLLRHDAVDIIQADVTRCGGLTELARIDALCAAANRPLSLHCAPAISAHAGCICEQLLHLEYFHDHVRIEDLLFEGAPRPVGGGLRPDLERPGHGLQLRRGDVDRYAVA